MPRYNLERHFTRDAAIKAAARPLQFLFCTTCCFCFNAAIEPSEMDYGIDYESSRASSPTFQAYLRDLVASLARAIGKQPIKSVIEIGCGDGQFLLELRSVLEFSGIGYDPSAGTDAIKSPYADLQFKQEYYKPSQASAHVGLMALRHVLEHQSTPKQFLESLGARSTELGALYLEVPSWEWIAQRKSCYVFSYEHCSYFSKKSLHTIFSFLGFPHAAFHFGFNDEYLQGFGSTFKSEWKDSTPAALGDPLALTKEYISSLKVNLQKLKELIVPIAKDCVLWGAAGRGTNLLNMCDWNFQRIPAVIDGNPKRTGTFIPLTGQEVYPPEALKQLNPRYVLITNELYGKEIAAQISANGVNAQIISLESLKPLA